MRFISVHVCFAISSRIDNIDFRYMASDEGSLQRILRKNPHLQREDLSFARPSIHPHTRERMRAVFDLMMSDDVRILLCLQ